MALAIAVALIGAESPQAVQVAVTGATPGDSYTINGAWADGEWVVRGGDSTVAVDPQIVLVDVASPIKVPLTYTVTHDADGAFVTSSSITVPHPDEEVLTSVDGLTVVRFQRRGNDGAPRSLKMRSTTFAIPGRLLPGVRFDVTAGEAQSMVIDTIDDDTDTLFDLLRSGGLVILRNDGNVRDTPAVQFLLVNGADSILNGIDNTRTWSLTSDVVDDPEPDVIVVVDTWDQLDAVYNVIPSTWANFDTEWSTQFWTDFDLEDWATR